VAKNIRVKYTNVETHKLVVQFYLDYMLVSNIKKKDLDLGLPAYRLLDVLRRNLLFFSC